MRIKAKFTGKDSLGYVHGQEYEFLIERNVIQRVSGGGECPYGSLEAFLKNWDDVKVLG